MSKSKPQDLGNHARIDPAFHSILFPVLAVNLIVSIVCAVRHPGFYPAWFIVLSLAAFIVFYKLRMYPLKVQDRVIRLEERLRLQALAPAQWHAQLYRLNEDQLIALRFASDDEVVELARQALEHNLSRKQIKERIKNWRADNWRV
jgi:hypothetical protein